jgi:hypothetical protein
MASLRRDLWGVLQMYCDKMGKEFLRASSAEQISALEKKWLDHNRGVVARLLRKPFLAGVSKSAREVFFRYLVTQVRNEVGYSTIWLQ